jgi:hypothetical protein
VNGLKNFWPRGYKGLGYDLFCVWKLAMMFLFTYFIRFIRAWNGREDNLLIALHAKYFHGFVQFGPFAFVLYILDLVHPAIHNTFMTKAQLTCQKHLYS